MLSDEYRRIRRIEYMERLYDEVRNADRDTDVSEKVRVLAEYYECGLWLQDYEADEQGIFPKDLKRGVLSQDGLYNLLDRVANNATQ